MDIKTVSELLGFSSEKMVKVNLFESRRMFCDLYCLEPGQQQKVHTHADNDKIYYVIHGEGSFTVGSEVQILRAGQIVCAWAGVPHGVENRSSVRLTCLIFMAPHPGI